MDYIIIDLEWNQPENNYRSKPLHGMPFEIIEIGAIKLNNKKEYISSFSEMIRPIVYTHIHHITHEITHFSSDDLKNCRTFPEVINDFINWCGDNCVFCIWGSMDLTELQRNMNYYDIPLLKFPVYYYDIQKIFSFAFEDGKLRRSLEHAVNILNIEKTRPFHRALDDAFYTAEIVKFLSDDLITSHYSIDTYQLPENKANEIYAVYDTHSKYISRPFENKTDVMEDKAVTSTTCYKCGKKLKKKIRWFSSNSKIYYCLCKCPDHGFIKGKIRMKKTDEDNYYAIKTLKITDEPGADIVYKKQSDIRKKRREKRHSKN